MFFYLCIVLFSGFLQFNGDFVDAQNNSEYRDWAPLMCANHESNVHELFWALGWRKVVTIIKDLNQLLLIDHFTVVGLVTLPLNDS